MTGSAAAASDPTDLVVTLGRTHEILVQQSRIPETDFGGHSGDAFRDHASRSPDAAAEAASDLALRAAALASLRRELESAAELRTMADRPPPVDAAETRDRADERERRAQAAWRTAVAGYEQRRRPSDVPGQPVVTHPPIGAEPPVRVEPVGLDVGPGAGPPAPAGRAPSGAVGRRAPAAVGRAGRSTTAVGVPRVAAGGP